MDLELQEEGRPQRQLRLLPAACRRWQQGARQEVACLYLQQSKAGRRRPDPPQCGASRFVLQTEGVQEGGFLVEGAQPRGLPQWQDVLHLAAHRRRLPADEGAPHRALQLAEGHPQEAGDDGQGGAQIRRHTYVQRARSSPRAREAQRDES